MIRICLVFMLVSQWTGALAQSSDNKIVAGFVDSLYSRTLGEYRKLWIHVPMQGGSGADRNGRFPVMYLLDGDEHFLSVTGMVQQLSEVNNNTICPDMVIVAILNTDRVRDFTPSRTGANAYFTADQVRQSGGSEHFSTFLQNELIPYIERRYPVTSYRTLIGHSFAGLFVMNTLVHHPDLFTSYVAIDPSVWWDDQRVLREAETAFHKPDHLASKSLYFTVAHTMPKAMDTTSVQRDTTGATSHIRANLQFGHFLSSLADSGWRRKWKYYDEDNHGSVPLISEYDALHYIFDFYKLPEGSFDLLTARDFSEHYQVVSKQMGYTLLPPENLMNQQGYVWLQRRNLDRAEGYFRLNLENYPEHANVYDSMGDLYIAEGDSKKAIEILGRARQCKDVTQDTIRKYEELRAKSR
jgi:hypothetical protein